MSELPESVVKARKMVGLFLFLIVIVGWLFESEKIGIINIGLPQESPNTVGTYYQVTKVVDGDTIHVDIDGNDEVVRLIGINTPETVDPRRAVECFGKESSKKMKELVGGEIVRLEYDDSQSLRDAYGRLLAYVYTEDGQMVNRKMVAEGYAYEYTYMLPYRYQSEFRDVQRLAKSSGRGLWSENTCNGTK